MRTSANEPVTVPSNVMASLVVASPSNVLSPSAGLPDRSGMTTRFFICEIPPSLRRYLDNTMGSPADDWSRTVYSVVKRIPPGRVATYGLVEIGRAHV